MKTLVISIPEQEFRVFNEKNQNWEIQSFEELNLEENENFATQIQEIQERFNFEEGFNFTFDVTIQIEIFNEMFEFELFGYTIQVKGHEMYNPETKESFIESENGKFICLGKTEHWDVGSLKLKDITIPSEVGDRDITVKGYDYEIEAGDLDVYDLFNYSNR